MVTPQGAGLPWPAIGDHQVAFGGAIQQVAIVIDQGRLHAEEGQGGGTGFGFYGSR